MWPVTWSGTPLCPHPPEPASGVRGTRAPAEETLFLPKYPCPVLTSVCGFLFVTVLIGLQPGWGCFLEPPPGLEPATRMAGTPPCMRPEDPLGEGEVAPCPRGTAHPGLTPSRPSPSPTPTKRLAGVLLSCCLTAPPLSCRPFPSCLCQMPAPPPIRPTHSLALWWWWGGPWRLLRAFRSVLPPILRPLHLPLHRTI